MKFGNERMKKQTRNLELGNRRNRQEIWNETKEEIGKKFGIEQKKKKGRNLE